MCGNDFFLILWFFRFIERKRISSLVTSAVSDNDKAQFLSIYSINL